MKVRLKHSLVLGNFFTPVFQFHEGPIKTLNSFVVQNILHMFQFHEGPIKTPRLWWLLPFRKLFQFHEGPIKTMLQKQQDWSERSFNSMKVRLKPFFSIQKCVLIFGFNSMKVRLKQFVHL